MFERFTHDARTVVTAAADAAVEAGSRRVYTTHILLGISTHGGQAGRTLSRFGISEDSLRAELARVGGHSGGSQELDTEALAAIGVDYEAVRQAAERRFGPGALSASATRQRPRGRSWWRWKGHTPFADESKRALVQALRVALERDDREIGPSHLLRGMLDDPFCTAVRFLAQRGVALDAVRATLNE